MTKIDLRYVSERLYTDVFPTTRLNIVSYKLYNNI